MHNSLLSPPMLLSQCVQMLPEYTFLFDTVDDEPVSDGADSIPYAPNLKSHIHPRDYFQIVISPQTVYVAQYVCQRVTYRVPTWQQSSGLPLGDLSALFRVCANNDQVNQKSNVDARLLRVPLQDLSKCTGLKQVYVTNAYIWVPLSAVVDVAFIAHADNVQNSYMQFGGKGVANSYYCYSTIRFSMSSSAEISVVSSILHHSHFFAFAFSNSPSHSHFSHTFNGRIFYALGSLRDATNKLMHTRRMFQKNGYRLTHCLSAECWGYLCRRLEGKCSIVDGEVERVRRLFLSDLAQEKRKFHRQRITTITIECQEELVSLRSVFGSSFCAGARCAPKLKDGVLPIKLHSAINVCNPPRKGLLTKIKRYKLNQKSRHRHRTCSPVVNRCLPVCLSPVQLTDDELLSCNSKMDMFQLQFDHTTSVVAVTVIFTRLIVGEDAHVLEALRSIGHNQLVESLVVFDLEVGVEFAHDGRKWMVEAIDGTIITASNSDDEVIRIQKNNITNLI